MTRIQHALALSGLAALTVLASTQCRSPEWKTDAPITDTHRSERQVDPGPVFARSTMDARVVEAGSLTVDADARGADGTSHLVSAPTPGLGKCRPYHLRAALPKHSVAVHDETRIWIRSLAPLPDAVEVKLWCRASRYRPEAGTLWRITVNNIGAAPTSATPPEFHHAAGTFLRHRLLKTRFDHFAAARLQAIKPMSDEALRRERQRLGRTDMAALMGFFTGMDSVEEALQTDRGVFVRVPPSDDEEVDIASVKGVDLAAHPWPSMIDELGRKPVLEPMATSIPADVAYLHFADLRTFVKVARDLDTWGTSAALALESNAGVNHFTDRYETELAVERTGLAENLGHLAADGVAVLLGDPYVREGTDVTLAFKIKNRRLLTGALAGFIESAKGRHPNLRSESMEVLGVPVEHHFTPDFTVNRYQAEVGGLLLVSNSEFAIRRMVLTHQGNHPRMSDAGDYLYMRTMYPFDAKEDGFLFLGDQWVARAVGPVQKIKESRRMRAHADLSSLNHAALLYGWLEGTPPKDEKSLLASGLARASDFVHDDGEKIVFHPERGASSSWGTPARLRPLAERALATAGKREVAAYKRFRQGYQHNWSTYIDPIAARIDRTDSGDYHVDARMLPLIDGSDYNELRRWVGDTRMPAQPVGYAAHLSVAIADDARLRRVVDELAFTTTGNNKLGIQWLGDWVMVGIGDRSNLWDLALTADMIEHGADPNLTNADLEASIIRAPVFLAAHVRNNLGLAAMLTALRAYSEQAAPGLVSWQKGEPYRDVPISEMREVTGPGKNRDPAVFSYCTVGDVVILAVDRATLEEQIDAFLDRTPSETADHQALISVRPDPDKSWLAHTVLGLMEEPSWRNNLRASRGYEVLAQGRGTLPSDPAARRAMAMTWLGHEPVGVHGQAYTVDADGLVGSALYGTIPAPKMPALPVTNSPLSDLINGIGGLQTSLSFEGEGNHSSLRARVTWVRK